MTWNRVAERGVLLPISATAPFTPRPKAPPPRNRTLLSVPARMDHSCSRTFTSSICSRTLTASAFRKSSGGVDANSASAPPSRRSRSLTHSFPLQGARRTRQGRRSSRCLRGHARHLRLDLLRVPRQGRQQGTRDCSVLDRRWRERIRRHGTRPPWFLRQAQD